MALSEKGRHDMQNIRIHFPDDFVKAVLSEFKAINAKLNKIQEHIGSEKELLAISKQIEKLNRKVKKFIP